MTCPKRCPNGTTCNDTNREKGQCVPKTQPKPAKKKVRVCTETEEECAKREIIHEVLEKVKKDTKRMSAEDRELVKKTAEKLESGSKTDMSWIRRQAQRADSLKLFLLRYKIYLAFVGLFATGLINYYSGGKLVQWFGKMRYQMATIEQQVEKEAIKEAAKHNSREILGNPIADIIVDAASKAFGKKTIPPIFTDKFLKTQYEILTTFFRRKRYTGADIENVYYYIKDHNIMCTKFEEGAAVINALADLIIDYIKQPNTAPKNARFNKVLQDITKLLYTSCDPGR